jgi:hypothetical protein
MLEVLEQELVSMEKPYQVDRRRSHRVAIDGGIPAKLEGLGRCRLVEVSLGGCILQTSRRLQAGMWHQMEVSYENALTELNVQTYHSYLYELYYADSGESRIHYHSRSVFCNPSISALNMLYRILADNWPPRGH